MSESDLTEARQAAALRRGGPGSERTFIHARCGGTLHGEPQPYWAIVFDDQKQVPVMNPGRMDWLHRCSRCGLIGVAV